MSLTTKETKRFHSEYLVSDMWEWNICRPRWKIITILVEFVAQGGRSLLHKVGGAGSRRNEQICREPARVTQCVWVSSEVELVIGPSIYRLVPISSIHSFTEYQTPVEGNMSTYYLVTVNPARLINSYHLYWLVQTWKTSIHSLKNEMEQ